MLRLARDAVVIRAGPRSRRRGGDGHEPRAITGRRHGPGRRGGPRTAPCGVDRVRVASTPVRVTADVDDRARRRGQPREGVPVAACNGGQLVVREARHRDGLDVRRHRRGGSDHAIGPGPAGDELIQPIAEVLAGEQQVTESRNLDRRTLERRGEHGSAGGRVDAVEAVEQGERSTRSKRVGRARRGRPRHDRRRPRFTGDRRPPR